MARKLREEYEGAIYPVMNRGDRREPIFRDDQDRLLFLETLGQACAKTDRQETTVTLKWIAERLKMGTWTHVMNRLYHLKK